jgi:hypothetical protein
MSGVIGAKDSAYFTHKNLFIDKKKKIMCIKSLCVQLLET